ncbi:MAG: response regulator transcription factor [Acidimicrobiales bacterium]
MAPLTVLVVEDDPVILRLLEVNFDMEGFVVRTATDGQEALDSVRTDRPDAVVVDIMMPVLSGLDFLAGLRGDPAIADVPVLLLSAKAQASDIRTGLAAGADDYVTKPFEPLDLVERVTRLVDRRSSTETHPRCS